MSTTKEAPKANLFAAPDSLLRNVDEVLREHPNRMGFMLELFENQHQHKTQGGYETWVRERMREILGAQFELPLMKTKKAGAR